MGYQKFFITDDNRKVPPLAEQLSNMCRFNGEVRSCGTEKPEIEVSVSRDSAARTS